ncbi:hypothetical protein [Chroococcidiopsis sp. CCNUC1]|uniref:hypothetical protein n=1 Tax=Chroococcidiopsis sp. CCNUC1 TaxID=2653189 RepID=UPI0020217139|nr:hypothetical protein [Chroococcidiopsis sp. CCNUC1]URD49672.1 hypothetical protein M5J74_25555 [Chroococcidiopsis sp. CCNUC1]
MAFNNQHYYTFTALLQLWGLPSQLVEPISRQLANIDNTQQDELIQLFAVELQKKQSLSEK